MKLFRLIFALAVAAATLPAWAQARYSYSAEGAEVTDAKTGLVWRRCSEGQAWSGSVCTGTASVYTHEQALAHAQGQTGWRLPNVKELGSLLDRSRFSPAIDVTAFPATPAASFWTSSPYTGTTNLAWGVGFYDGYVDSSLRHGALYVRLVR